MTERADAEDLRRVHAGRRDDDPKVRRYRAGAGPRIAFLRADERIGVGRKPAGRRIAVHGSPSAGGRACRGACSSRSVMTDVDVQPVVTILVVEDNEASRDALSRRLERHGYRVLLAVDGLQAVSVARTSLPDLILMDLGLPVLDGWDATRQLKSDAATQHIPIIVLERACDDQRPRQSARGGRRRFRHEAHPLSSPSGKDRMAPRRKGGRLMNRRGSHSRRRRQRVQPGRAVAPSRPERLSRRDRRGRRAERWSASRAASTISSCSTSRCPA